MQSESTTMSLSLEKIQYNMKEKGDSGKEIGDWRLVAKTPLMEGRKRQRNRWQCLLKIVFPNNFLILRNFIITLRTFENGKKQSPIIAQLNDNFLLN